jgi:hypothetical protein
MSTLNYTGQLVVTQCWCGVRHAVPSELYEMVERQHRDGKPQTNIYCPLGHSWGFAGTPEIEQVRAELQRSRQATKASRELLHAEERSHAATRGHLTRQKRRAAAGVCPCCHRTFKQLAQHMQTKHPDYIDTEVTP